MANTSKIKRDFLTSLMTDNWERSKNHPKRSFWPSDCLRPGIEIFWRWTNEPETNPIQAEKLLMFQAANMFEIAIIDRLQKIGIASDLSEGVKVSNRTDEYGRKQARVEYKRNGVPISGYMDGVSVGLRPIEVKSYYSTKVDSELEKGYCPSEHYLHQLACYIDYMEKDSGLIVMANRSTGNVFFVELMRVSEWEFECGDRSCVDLIDGKENIIPQTERGKFNLKLEYDRWFDLYYNNIKTLQAPPLDYEYRPTITDELLANYPEDKIKKAIKGDRVLSDHRWRPQYCNWKDKWIETECKQKGFDSAEQLIAYTDEEIELMMEYLNVEWRDTKAGPKLYKKRG